MDPDGPAISAIIAKAIIALNPNDGSEFSTIYILLLVLPNSHACFYLLICIETQKMFSIS